MDTSITPNASSARGPITPITPEQQLRIMEMAADAARAAVREALADVSIPKDVAQVEIIEAGKRWVHGVQEAVERRVYRMAAEGVLGCRLRLFYPPFNGGGEHFDNSYFRERLAYWTGFWKNLGIADPDFEGIRPFDDYPGYWNCIMAGNEQITAQWMFEKCCELFPCKEEGDCIISKSGPRDDIRGLGFIRAYPVWFLNSQEADPPLRGLSRFENLKGWVVGINLIERLMLEIDYFKRTGLHLDQETETVCPGWHHGYHTPIVKFRNGVIVITGGYGAPESAVREAFFDYYVSSH
ncbi:MAG: hypothetical protein PHR36_00230 [Patescibacteria group bacterium]|nr:hypothetical protein [Patescibacteria group bacterium]